MSSKPRIFIGVPCYGAVEPEVLEDFSRFTFHCGRRLPQFDFFLGVKTKSEQFRARNAIVDGARQTNCDWLLMLDDDMIVNPFVTSGPCDDYGFLEKLIAHDKDICGVLYYQRGGNCEPVLMRKVNEAGYRFLREDEIEHRLQRVDVVGGGCLLVKMRVFDKVGYPYFSPEYKFGTDVQLCQKAADLGFEVWADTSIELGHLKQDKAIITSRNRKQFQFEETIPGDVTRSFVATDPYLKLRNDVLEYTGKGSEERMFQVAFDFLRKRKESGLDDAEWYRQYPIERVCRQFWYNTQDSSKKQMTQFILSAIDHKRKMNILDFGCGIGIPAFYLAEKGHDVTAMDIRGTGTLEFLKWRAKKHGVPIKFVESEGGAPEFNGERYDAVIAMDSIEHIGEWKKTVQALGAVIKPQGALFSNNGILEDVTHPEHYNIDNKEFINTCMESGLMPVNQITFVKKAPHG